MNRPKFLLFVLLGCLVLSGELFADENPHVVIVVGTHHYSAHRSLPVFAEELVRLGFQVTLINGEGDPEKKTENVLPGIEALEDADVAIFYMRFLNLPQNEWEYIESYIKSGKPVIGMRTTNHALKFAADDSRVEWNNGFGPRVMGTPYVAHQSTRSNIRVVKKHDSHEVLTGVSTLTWESPAKLYLTRLEPGCVPILTGDGEGKPRLLEKSFGTIQVNEYETDVVAWTWQNEWGAKVFATSLGHAGDFAEEAFTRMLVNSVYWAVNRQPPGSDEKIATFEIEMEVPSKYRERK